MKHETGLQTHQTSNTIIMDFLSSATTTLKILLSRSYPGITIYYNSQIKDQTPIYQTR